MNQIKLLDNSTINKIAAGEVVESPKSVVKELTENAIDAGSTAVTVEIREGGISFIRITDNGCGIPKEQVKTAFLRHATNKIQQIEDLESVLSLGFRGEALASIAAVAQVEMITKTQDEITGTQIEIHGGEVISVQDVACTVGTTILVKNLFYNVPARRKFLKKPATESGYISDIMNKIALGHPEISFKYINNHTTILHTSGNKDRKTAVFYVYGKETAGNMIELEYTDKTYRVTGLIGKPELSRANRTYENLFINGRFVKNSIVSSGIEDAYKTRLLVGKFPVYVLNFEILPSMVDVNVHPAKLEVRFHNEDEIYAFFYDAVTKALQDKVLIPKANWEGKASDGTKEFLKNHQEPFRQEELLQEMQEENKNVVVYDNLSVKEENHSEGYKTIDELLHVSKANNQTINESTINEDRGKFSVSTKGNKQSVSAVADTMVRHEKSELVSLNISEKTDAEPTFEPFFKNYKIVGQVFNTYWMIEQGSSLFMIDQHAAHERILYEELMERFKKESLVSQRLLEPLMLQLTVQETVILKDNLLLLNSFGFDVEEFGEKTFALRSVPFIMRGPTGARFFIDIIDMLGNGNIANLYDTKVLAIATMACKAAVKANDRLSLQEASALVERLLKLENPFTCPHGRPTIIEMTKYELEKKFKRIQN